jgi:hypothetical protein
MRGQDSEEQSFDIDSSLYKDQAVMEFTDLSAGLEVIMPFFINCCTCNSPIRFSEVADMPYPSSDRFSNRMLS